MRSSFCAAPVDLARRLGAGERQHPGHDRRRQRRLAGRARLVAQQTVHALLGEATLPAPHCWPTQPGPARHLENRQPFRRKQNDPRPLNVLQRSAAIADHRGQSRAVLGSYDHANILCHGRRLAQPYTFVNPAFVSVH